MKVFISWSGELSRQIGDVIRGWLPSVLQSVRPYFTPSDIEKGARWQSEIARELQECSVGIFCLTRENLNSKWLMFEAGAISKVVDSAYVCPILFKVRSVDIVGPLQQFQSTEFSKDEIFKLIALINKHSGNDSLDTDTLTRVFNKWWPDLQTPVENILESYAGEQRGATRTEPEMIEEILNLTRLVAGDVERRRESENRAAIMQALINRFKGGPLVLNPDTQDAYQPSGFLTELLQEAKKADAPKPDELTGKNAKGS